MQNDAGCVFAVRRQRWKVANGLCGSIAELADAGFAWATDAVVRTWLSVDATDLLPALVGRHEAFASLLPHPDAGQSVCPATAVWATAFIMCVMM